MTITAIRHRLISYLADPDDNKVKAVFTLLEKEIDEKQLFVLSDEQLQILDKERELHVGGQSKSYNRNEARQIIKGERA
ncbi:hypothetical protein ACPPVU_09685 [Mucilaginibacter sp. McL0603]|uniref:hypothetical protein n=1 Tax=Mucilaginibacter sp. McL0603 TaxID=3415670 RepID=UPI003CEB200A